MNKPTQKRRRSNDTEPLSVAKKICKSAQMVVCFDCNNVFESGLRDLGNHICGTEQAKVIDQSKIKQCIGILNSKLNSALSSNILLAPTPPPLPPPPPPPPPPLPPVSLNCSQQLQKTVRVQSSSAMPPLGSSPPLANTNNKTSAVSALMDSIQKGTTLRKVYLSTFESPSHPKPIVETDFLNELTGKLK